MSEKGFSYSISDSHGYRLFALRGRLMGREQAEDLMLEFNHAVQQDKAMMLLDLAELEYVNSSGLNLLIGLLTKTRNAGSEMVICGVSDKVRSLLVMTKLDSVFRIHGSVEDAIDHFKA